MGICHCHHPQQLREVPLYQPMIMLVVTGHKEALLNQQRWVLHSGDLFITPPDITLWVNNFPDQQGLPFLGLVFTFSPESVKQFRQLYGTQLLDTWETSPKWQTKAPEEIITALHQWLHWSHRFSVDPQILQHRQVELLLLLARAGLVGNILLGEHPSWRQRVAQLLNMDIARNWKVQDVCQRLALSESSLRRHLQEEQSSFREILENARLVAGLSLLQETFWPIVQVAEAVGYQSQSRFGERFKFRFGMTPSELRRTRVAENQLI